LNFYLLQEGITGNQIINARFAERYDNWRKSIAEDTAKIFGISDQQILDTLGAIILAVIDGLTMQKLIASDSVNMEQIAFQLASMIKAQKKWETLKDLFSDVVTS
jgi:tryptophan synthase alpha subunit